jgi:hypothetical protein
LAIAAAANSEGLGIFLVTWGNQLSARDYCCKVIPWALRGAFFIAAPLLALALRVIAAIAKDAAAEHRCCQSWKATLTPEQRAAVEVAETAAAAAAAIAMWEHHKRVDAGLTSSVMGRTMPDGHTLRPLDKMAAYRQQKALRFPPQQPWGAPDLTAASSDRAQSPGAPGSCDGSARSVFRHS